MRIRSVKPEFYRSDDITALDWDTRLLFIGLWSYVDDNGVGVDRLASIAADLFAGDLVDNAPETFARVSRGLQTLSEAGLITRYVVDGRPYLHVTSWDKHQRIDKPNKPRFPLPSSENVQILEPIRDTLATPSRDSSETPAPGTGEQGNRGTGEQNTRPSAPADEEFDEFWTRYPRKISKGQARKAWRTAARKVDDPRDIIDACRRFAVRVHGSDEKFIPHAATWLNGERWLDDDKEPQAEAVGGWRGPIGPPPAPPEIADDPERYAVWLDDWRRENGR